MYWLHALLQAPVPRIEVIPATRMFVTLIQISNPAGAVGAALSEETKKELLKTFKSSEMEIINYGVTPIGIAVLKTLLRKGR